MNLILSYMIFQGGNSPVLELAKGLYLVATSAFISKYIEESWNT